MERQAIDRVGQRLINHIRFNSINHVFRDRRLPADRRRACGYPINALIEKHNSRARPASATAPGTPRETRGLECRAAANRHLRSGFPAAS
jgi:hypothetical protein